MFMNKASNIRTSKPISKNNGGLDTSSVTNSPTIESILNSEQKTVATASWSKLSKTSKLQKMRVYIHTVLVPKYELTEEETILLINYVVRCVDRKQLVRVKDVVYDKSTGIITGIPGLSYQKNSRKFTLKRGDKRVSTLKSLGPKKGDKNKKG